MVFSIFCKSFIIFEQVIYPQQKCEAWLLLLVGCLRETIAQAVGAIYLSFVNVCMSMFFWGDDVWTGGAPLDRS